MARMPLTAWAVQAYLTPPLSQSYEISCLHVGWPHKRNFCRPRWAGPGWCVGGARQGKKHDKAHPASRL